MATPKPLLLLLLLLLPSSLAPPPTSPPPPLRQNPLILGPPANIRDSTTTKAKQNQWKKICILVVIIPPTVFIGIYSVLTVLRERYPDVITFELRDLPGQGHTKLYLTITLVVSYLVSAGIMIYKMITA